MPWHYHMRTRQTCNIIFEDDDFKTTIKNKDPERIKIIDDMKTKTYQKIIDNRDLEINKNLKFLSPKMFQIMININKVIVKNNGFILLVIQKNN